VRRLGVLFTAVLTLALCSGLTGCSGSSDNGESLDTRLAAAKQSLDGARFIGFTLSSEDLPDTTALESAHGTGTHAPAFTGEVQIKRGLSFTAPLVAVGGKVYAKLPFVDWSTIDPADYGAPDPSVLMDRSTGISSLLTDATKTSNAGSERSGDVVLTKIRGTLPGHAVHALFPSSGQAPFAATFTLTDDDVLHSVSMTGPFYGPDHASSTYSIDLDLSADPVTITAPQ
jgi:lipoprotein LprG